MLRKTSKELRILLQQHRRTPAPRAETFHVLINITRPVGKIIRMRNEYIKHLQVEKVRLQIIRDFSFHKS